MLEGFTLRHLASTDSAKSMKAGYAAFAPLKTFAQRHAHRYEEERLSRTYVVHDDAVGCLAAYMTLVCSEVASGEQMVEAQEQGLHFPYRHWPAVKISRLLVDARYRREGARHQENMRLGATLVKLAIGVAMEQICPAVGCRFVMVDSKAEAVEFYERLGFRLLDTDANREREERIMFIDLHKVAI